MKHILHIHDDNLFTWIQLSNTGEILATQEINHLSATGPIDPKNHWLIIIPGQQVLMTTVPLPKTNRRELVKAIPYILEDQLTNEVDKLYFALGDYHTQNCLTVAVIDKKIFEHYLHLLKAYQIFPTVMLPDYLVIPFIENRWSLMINDEMAFMRTEKQSGFATFHNNIRLLLQLTLEKYKEKLPQKINVYNISKSNRKNLEAANHLVAIENISRQNPFAYLETLQNPPFNLLQHRYRPTLKLTHQNRHWLFAGIMGVIWLVVLLGGKSIIGYDLKYHLHNLQTQLNQNYQQLFPGSAEIVDPRQRIEHELNALTRNSRDSRLTHLLGQTAAILHHYPNVNLQSLNYQHSVLSLQLTVDNLAQLTKFVHQLNEQGLDVKQNQLNTDNKKITAELIIQ